MGLLFFILGFFLVLGLVVEYVKTPRTQRENWFRAKDKRDQLVYRQLVLACGNNRELANKMIAHEQLMNERLSRHHATVAALNRIQNYRRHEGQKTIG